MFDIFTFCLAFLAFVLVDLIVNIILEIIKTKLAIKAQEQKIDSLYLQIIHKVKAFKSDLNELKDEKGEQ